MTKLIGTRGAKSPPTPAMIEADLNTALDLDRRPCWYDGSCKQPFTCVTRGCREDRPAPRILTREHEHDIDG